MSVCEAVASFGNVLLLDVDGAPHLAVLNAVDLAGPVGMRGRVVFCGTVVFAERLWPVV